MSNVNPYSANPFAANDILAARRNQLVSHRSGQRVGMIEVGQTPASYGPAAASPVYGGFGAQPGLHPVRNVAPQEIRGSALGFDSVANVAAAGVATITSRPQQAFRPEKLVVASSIAASFIITDIKIGNTSMLLNTIGIPAETFTPDAVGVHLRWKTAQPAQDAVLDVSNITAAAARFLASLTGTVAE